MAKENAVLDENQNLNEDLSDSFDFDELEEKLQSQLEVVVTVQRKSKQ